MRAYMPWLLTIQDAARMQGSQSLSSHFITERNSRNSMADEDDNGYEDKVKFVSKIAQPLVSKQLVGSLYARIR